MMRHEVVAVRTLGSKRIGITIERFIADDARFDKIKKSFPWTWYIRIALWWKEWRILLKTSEAKNADAEAKRKRN